MAQAVPDQNFLRDDEVATHLGSRRIANFYRRMLTFNNHTRRWQTRSQRTFCRQVNMVMRCLGHRERLGLSAFRGRMRFKVSLVYIQNEMSPPPQQPPSPPPQQQQPPSPPQQPPSPPPLPPSPPPLPPSPPPHTSPPPQQPPSPPPQQPPSPPPQQPPSPPPQQPRSPPPQQPPSPPPQQPPSPPPQQPPSPPQQQPPSPPQQQPPSPPTQQQQLPRLHEGDNSMSGSSHLRKQIRNIQKRIKAKISKIKELQGQLFREEPGFRTLGFLAAFLKFILSDVPVENEPFTGNPGQMTKLNEEVRSLLGLDEDFAFDPNFWEQFTPILNERLQGFHLAQYGAGVFVTVNARDSASRTVLARLNSLKRQLRILCSAKENVEKSLESQE